MEEELLIELEGITLRGSVVYPSGISEYPLVILCHGIPSGQQVEGDPGYEALAGRFAGLGIGACFFNFRGTGLSGGDFSLGGWVRDLEAVLDAAEKKASPFGGCEPGRIAIMGFSGGGAVSAVCASRRRGLAGLALLSSPAEFSNLLPRGGMRDFIDHARAIGIIRDPAFPPSEERYYREMVAHSPVDVVGGVAPTPLLVVHGDLDDLVPVSEAYRLYEAAGEPKELFIVRGGGHKLRLDPEAMDRAVGWVEARLG